MDFADVDLADAFEILAETRDFPEAQVFAFHARDERHVEARCVIVEGHETILLPDFDEALIFGRKIRAELFRVDLCDAIELPPPLTKG